MTAPPTDTTTGETTPGDAAPATGTAARWWVWWRVLGLWARPVAVRTGARWACGLWAGLRWLGRLARPRSVAGLAGAALIYTVLHLAVAARAWVAHERWSRAATWLVDVCWQPRVVLSGLGVALLGWLITGLSPTVGGLLVLIGLAPLGLRVARGAYPHTRRGRVRTRYQVVSDVRIR